MILADETWGVFLVGGRELIACVHRTADEFERLDDREWVTLERVSHLTIQVGMTPRGPAVAPVTLPLGAASDSAAKLRVRVRAIEGVWWFSTMAAKAQAEFEKRAAEAARAATALAASSAGIVT